jgi:type II secretory pathway component PulJ
MRLILLAIVAAIAWYGYKSFVRDAERVSRKARRTEKEMRNQAAGTLVQDPETGEYRPADD